MCRLCYTAYIREFQSRITWCLDPNELSFARTDEFFDVDFDGGCECDGDAVCGGDLGEVAVCAAVDVRDGDDVGACGEGLEDCRCCC